MGEINEKYPIALPIGTVLARRYLIIEVLGQGGFGITYKAKYNKNNEIVAIKEFFPNSMATRTNNTTVTPFSGSLGESFQYGKECFLKEAQTLSEFISNPDIVRILRYFEENGTAYFVMEYIEGESFDKYIKKRGGSISWDEASRILIPIMDALGSVHAKGIVHRDVSPDNIIISDNGRVKLLDFGAARYSLGDKSRSLDVVLKHGYAPKEQYLRHGKQGAFTDIYALGATFYFALTGKRPPDSIERLEEDNLVPPSVLGAKLPFEAEDAIIKALSVLPNDRYQTMEEFKNDLLATSDVLSGLQNVSVPDIELNSYDSKNYNGSSEQMIFTEPELNLGPESEEPDLISENDDSELNLEKDDSDLSPEQEESDHSSGTFCVFNDKIINATPKDTLNTDTDLNDEDSSSDSVKKKKPVFLYIIGFLLITGFSYWLILTLNPLGGNEDVNNKKTTENTFTESTDETFSEALIDETVKTYDEKELLSVIKGNNIINLLNLSYYTEDGILAYDSNMKGNTKFHTCISTEGIKEYYISTDDNKVHCAYFNSKNEKRQYYEDSVVFDENYKYFFISDKYFYGYKEGSKTLYCINRDDNQAVGNININSGKFIFDEIGYLYFLQYENNNMYLYRMAAGDFKQQSSKKKITFWKGFNLNNNLSLYYSDSYIYITGNDKKNNRFASKFNLNSQEFEISYTRPEKDIASTQIISIYWNDLYYYAKLSSGKHCIIKWSLDSGKITYIYSNKGEYSGFYSPGKFGLNKFKICFVYTNNNNFFDIKINYKGDVTIKIVK